MGASNKELLETAIINRVSGGLLGFLGIKSGGLGPGRLLYDVRPTVDMRTYWELGSTVTITQSQSATPPTTASTFANFLVPQGELWYVSDFGAAGNSVPVASITSVGMSFGVHRAIGGVNFTMPVTPWQVFNFIAANAENWATQIVKPFWMFAGDQIAWRTSLLGGAGGAGMTANVMANVVKYTV